MQPETTASEAGLRSRIPNFSEALALLTAQPYPPPHPTRFISDLITRTQPALVAADISNLQAHRSKLHPINQYLPYISLLNASLANVPNDSPLIPYLLADLKSLIKTAPSSHVAPANALWIGVCRHAARLAVEVHNIPRAMSLIKPLQLAAFKLSSSPDVLLPIHADFLALCLEAKCYKVAIKWLEQRRRQIVPETGIVATDVHLIFHYSALVLIGVKQFRPALQSCRLALAVPAPSPGIFFQAAVATFRLYVLLHLLVFAKAPSPLRFSSYQPSRLRMDASEYLELAYAFELMDASKTHQLFESNRTVFTRHSTIGLVKQVIEELSKRLIIRLSKSFVTITLSQLMQRAALRDEEQAIRIICELIDAGRLNATIDEQNGVIRLFDDDSIEESRIEQQMSSQHVNHCLDIVGRIEQFRDKLENDPAYIKKELSIHQKKRSVASYAAATAGIPDLDSDFLMK